MKKFLAALSLFALLNTGTCIAENVQAVGRGITERMAIHDALRLAIEKKFGASVHARTRVKNSVLVSDDTSVDSAGLIQRWEVVSSRVENGIFIVTVEAELDDKKISAAVDRKALVDFNADNPRVAVVAVDSSGRRCLEVENEIITALKRQGFTRTTDLVQINRAVRQRITSTEDRALCKTLANDFHADCLVLAEVNATDGVSVSSRLINLNTGEIIFAGTSSSNGAFLSRGDELKLAGRRAGNEIASAAL